MPFIIEEPEEIQQQGRFAIEEPEEGSSILLQKAKNTAKDVAEQALIGGAKGLAGTYGNILSLIRAQRPSAVQNLVYPEGVEEQRQAVLRSGDPDSGFWGRFQDVLTATDEDRRTVGGLPTSRDIEGMLQLGGIDTEAEAMPGRFAGRIGELIGSSASFGVPQPLVSATAGTVGQALEEAGAPPAVQALGELGVFIGGGLLSGSTAVRATARTDQGRKVASGLRDLNYSEEAIQSAINATEREGGIVSKWAKGTKQTKKAFEEADKGLNQLFDDALSQAFPGIEDLGAMEARAGALFEAIPNVKITNPKPFIKTADSIVSDLKNTLANTPDEVSIIKMIEESIVAASENPSSEAFINFYQSLNRAGKWLKPKMRERIFTEMKDSIKQTFAESGKEGQALVKQFERANQGWVRLNKARDVSKTLEGAITEEGINFKKMGNILDNPKKAKLLNENLGNNNVKMLKDISKRGNDVAKLTKRLESPRFADQLSKYGLTGGLVTSIATMNPAPLLAATGAAVTKEATHRLAGKMLTDPNFQKLTLKTLKSSGTASARELAKYQQEAIDLVSGYDLD